MWRSRSELVALVQSFREKCRHSHEYARGQHQAQDQPRNNLRSEIKQTNSRRFHTARIDTETRRTDKACHGMDPWLPSQEVI